MKTALREYLLALADDELILGHRASEWCGHAPILEEDIAFANLALDEIGHASLWYSVLAEIEEQDPAVYPDRLAYFREPQDFRNIQMVELPKGDWAFTIMRQYLFDAYEQVRLESLLQSSYEHFAQVARKIRQEEFYHFRHSSAWVRRLGAGTQESQRRMQIALDELWTYTGQLFQPIPEESDLIQAGYVIASENLKDKWQDKVYPTLIESSLVIPATPRLQLNRQTHTHHLEVLLSEMQSVARLEADANW